MASRKNVPSTSIDEAKPMPTIEVSARTGCRSMLRTTMRPGGPNRRPMPARSRMLGR